MRNSVIVITSVALIALLTNCTVADAAWYSDDFESYGIGATVPGWSDSRMNVQYDSEDHSDTSNKVYGLGALTGGGVRNIYNPEEYSDFTYVAKFTGYDAGWSSYDGFIFRYQDTKNYYQTWFRNGLRLLKKVDGVSVTIADGSYGWLTGVPVWVRVDADGNRIKVYTASDGVTWTKQIDAIDSDYSVGEIGLNFTSHSHFDDVAVTELQPDPCGDPCLPLNQWYSEDFDELTVGDEVADWPGSVVALDGENNDDPNTRVFKSAFGGEYYYEGSTYSDFTFIGRFKWFDAALGRHAGPLFRYVNGSNHYRAWFLGGVSLRVVREGVNTDYPAASPLDPNTSMPDTWYWMKVEAVGEHILVHTSLDGQDWTEQIHIVDDTSSEGKFALGGGLQTHYDDISISEPPTLTLECGDVGTTYLPLDVSGPSGAPDCYINLHDFSALADDWLKSTVPEL